MSARLVPLSGAAAPVISLRRPVQLVGRHPECDVRIEQMKVSRRHCCLALVYDRVVVRDLGSRNGVRVNGVLVEEATLLPGDEVAIGPVLYRVEGAVDTPLPAPTPAPAGEGADAATPPYGGTALSPPDLPALSNGSDDAEGDLLPLVDL